MMHDFTVADQSNLLLRSGTNELSERSCTLFQRLVIDLPFAVLAVPPFLHKVEVYTIRKLFFNLVWMTSPTARIRRNLLGVRNGESAHAFFEFGLKDEQGSLYGPTKRRDEDQLDLVVVRECFARSLALFAAKVCERGIVDLPVLLV